MKKIILVLGVLSFISCDVKTDCKAFAEKYKAQECLIIVDTPPDAGSVYFKTEGRDLATGKNCNCTQENRWWATFSDQIEKGDTIIKRKGELVFTIHKKDTILNFDWQCDGKIYK